VVRDERRGVEHARLHHRQHAVHVADHVGVSGLQRQRLDPDDPHVHLDPLGVDADRRHRAGLAGEPAGELECVGVPHGVHGQVHAASLGERLHGGARVVLGEVRRRGAELLGGAQPVLHAVHGDHVRGAGGPGGLNRA
jgi:hypothetical protein